MNKKDNTVKRNGPFFTKRGTFFFIVRQPFYRTEFGTFCLLLYTCVCTFTFENVQKISGNDDGESRLLKTFSFYSNFCW